MIENVCVLLLAVCRRSSSLPAFPRSHLGGSCRTTDEDEGGGSSSSHHNINSLFLSARNLPDVTAENFSNVDLRQFKWIHWEVSEGLEVLEPVPTTAPHITFTHIGWGVLTVLRVVPLLREALGSFSSVHLSDYWLVSRAETLRSR